MRHSGPHRHETRVDLVVPASERLRENVPLRAVAALARRLTDCPALAGSAGP
jgi:hypothetical protein